MVKKCSSCRIISMKSNFQKKSRSKDGLTSHCKVCKKIYRKKYYSEHYDLEIDRRRKYRFDNKK